MNRLYSLIRASMTSDMSIFKINQKKHNKKSAAFLPIFVGIFFMIAIWGNANMIFEKIAPMHLQVIILSILVFGVSIITIIEGVYKTGSLIFNCKDDQLLLSLPIKRSTVLFLRIFKFYVFELIFNSLIMIPILLAYVRWADAVEWTFYLTSFVMLLLLPVIPIVISCIVGGITSSISSRFKYKNAVQIIFSMIALLIILYISFNLDSIFNYLAEHATSINDLITKIYYPAGAYATLITDFNIATLLIFILVNVAVSALGIFILSKFYFKINSRLKKVTTTKKTNVKNLAFKSHPARIALIKKELNTFFKTPVFIINAGFGLVLFIIGAVLLSIKFDLIMPLLENPETFNFSAELINSNIPLLVFLLIAFASFMTSITSSVISLEGKNINILKSLPVETKTILMSKIYSSLVLTTPILLIGDIILFARFNIGILEILLLLILSVAVPLISHYIGLIINLKYPKLDAENTAEVVKQSTSSFVSVMVGMILLAITFVIIFGIIGKISATLILVIATAIFIVMDTILYIYLIKIGSKDFNKLSV